MLQPVQTQVGQACSFLIPGNAENATLIVELIFVDIEPITVLKGR